MIVASLLMQGRNYREQTPRFFIFKLPDICGTDLTIYGISWVDIVTIDVLRVVSCYLRLFFLMPNPELCS